MTPMYKFQKKEKRNLSRTQKEVLNTHVYLYRKSSRTYEKKSPSHLRESFTPQPKRKEIQHAQKQKSSDATSLKEKAHHVHVQKESPSHQRPSST